MKKINVLPFILLILNSWSCNQHEFFGHKSEPPVVSRFCNCISHSFKAWVDKVTCGVYKTNLSAALNLHNLLSVSSFPRGSFRYKDTEGYWVLGGSDGSTTFKGFMGHTRLYRRQLLFSHQVTKMLFDVFVFLLLCQWQVKLIYLLLLFRSSLPRKITWCSR